MINNSLLCCICLALFSNCCLYAADNITAKDICSFKTGDTIQLIEPPGDSIDGYLYAFTGEGSCYSCVSSLNYINKLINRYAHIKSFLFFYSTNNVAATKFHDDYARDYELILDRIGAYAKCYGIKFEPSFIIINRYGRIYHIQKLGSPGLDDLNAETLMNRIKSDNHSSCSSDNALRLMKTIKLHYKGEPVISNNYNSFLYEKSSNSYYFLRMDKPELFKSDSNGICDLVSDAELIKANRIYQGYCLRWHGRDSLLYILNMAYPSRHIITEFNTKCKSHKLKQITIPKKTDVNFDVINDCIIFAKNFLSDSTHQLLHEEKLLIKVDQNSLISEFAIPDSIYLNNRLSTFAKAVFKVNNDNEIITWQKSSDKICFYNDQGFLLKSIKVNLPDTYIYPKSDLPVKLTHAYWQDTLYSYARNAAILCDEISGNYALLYTYWTNELDRNSNIKNDKLYYMHLMDRSCKPLFVQDIAFPVNTIPFHIENGFVYTQSVKNSELEIKIYSLE